MKEPTVDELIRALCERECTKCGETRYHDPFDEWCLHCEIGRPAPIFAALNKGKDLGKVVKFKIKVKDK